MFVSVLFRLAQSHAVDDGGVVELVAHQRIFGAQQRLEYSPIGVEATRVENRIVATVKLGNFSLEINVNILIRLINLTKFN